METIIIAALGALAAGGGWAYLRGKWKKLGRTEAVREADEKRSSLGAEEAKDKAEAAKKKSEIKELDWDELKKGAGK